MTFDISFNFMTSAQLYKCQHFWQPLRLCIYFQNETNKLIENL